MAYTAKNYEAIILQLTHIVVTEFTGQDPHRFFVYALADTGRYYPVGKWFATVDESLAYATCLEDKVYTLDELRALAQPASTDSQPVRAPSTITQAVWAALATSETMPGQHCSRCQQSTQELLTSATGLLCPECYDTMNE